MSELWYNQTLKLDTINLMRKYGGSFVQALAECILRADKDNLGKLEHAFADYIKTYHPDNWKAQHGKQKTA